MVIPGFISPVSNVKITLLDRERRSMWNVGRDQPNEFVTTVRDEIYDLTWTLDIEQVASALDEEEVK